jgi:hypothetical protein
MSAPLDDESLPRDNGELVFEAPWQARALAIAVALVDKLDLPWDAFRRRLMDENCRGPTAALLRKLECCTGIDGRRLEADHVRGARRRGAYRTCAAVGYCP